jgi:hypothetical protein
MFRHLFLSLLVYANGSAIQKAPAPPTVPESDRPAVVGTTTDEIPRPGLLGLVPYFLPDQPITGDALESPTDPDPEVAAFPDFAFSDIVVTTSEKYGVDWRLVAAVISAESSFNPRARSSKGARGLMQVMPRTAALYDVKPGELYNPRRNVEAGVRHLKMLQERYEGDLELAVAAYNTGEAAVDRHHGIPPYRVTRAFVKKVLSGYHERQDATLQAMGDGGSGTGSTLLSRNSGPSSAP